MALGGGTYSRGSRESTEQHGCLHGSWHGVAFPDEGEQPGPFLPQPPPLLPSPQVETW